MIGMHLLKLIPQHVDRTILYIYKASLASKINRGNHRRYVWYVRISTRHFNRHNKAHVTNN